MARKYRKRHAEHHKVGKRHRRRHGGHRKGKPLSAAHKAAISRGLRKHHRSGGHKRRSRSRRRRA